MLQIDNEKIDEFIYKREREDEIYQYYKNKGIPISHINATSFGLFLKFQKDIYRLFRQIDIKSPSAYRLFLYLVENCVGFNNDLKSSLLLTTGLLKECNIKTRKSLYEAIRCLQDKNIIFIKQTDNVKYIKINPSILSWNVDEDRKMKVYQKEVDRINASLAE